MLTTINFELRQTVLTCAYPMELFKLGAVIVSMLVNHTTQHGRGLVEDYTKIDEIWNNDTDRYKVTMTVTW